MDEPKRQLDDICMLCGENEPMQGRDICSSCGSDARTLGPEADWLLSDEPEYPDYANDEERFAEGYRGDGR